MNITAPTWPSSAKATKLCPDPQGHDHSVISKPRTFGELLAQVIPLICAPAIYGPPISFVLGPWLLLVLLLIGPVTLLFTIVLVVVVAAWLLVALVALVAAPYLLVRHLRAQHAPRRPRFAFLCRPAVSATIGDFGPHPGRSSWFPAPVAGRLSAHASIASSRDGQHISTKRYV